MKLLKSKILFVIFMTLLHPMLSCISEEEEMENGTVELRVGDQLPDFQVRMNDGTIISNKDLLQHCSLVTFFHTQCPNCQKEFPVLQQLYENCPYPFKMVCISRKESATDIEKYWKAHQLTLPYSAQEDAKIYHLFAKSAIPRIYISDEDEKIRSIYTDNPIATYEELLTDIKNIVKN